MGELRTDRLSRFGDDTEGFKLFFETEPLEGEALAERLRLLEAEEPEIEGE